MQPGGMLYVTKSDFQIQVGHLIVGIASFVLITGIALFLWAASVSREDEYWFGLVMTSYIWPLGSLLAIVGLAMLQLIPFRRFGRKGPT